MTQTPARVRAAWRLWITSVLLLTTAGRRVLAQSLTCEAGDPEEVLVSFSGNRAFTSASLSVAVQIGRNVWLRSAQANTNLGINALFTVRQFSQHGAHPDVRARVHIGGTRLASIAELSSPDSLRVTSGEGPSCPEPASPVRTR